MWILDEGSSDCSLISRGCNSGWIHRFHLAQILCQMRFLMQTCQLSMLGTGDVPKSNNLPQSDSQCFWGFFYYYYLLTLQNRLYLA